MEEMGRQPPHVREIEFIYLLTLLTRLLRKQIKQNWAKSLGGASITKYMLLETVEVLVSFRVPLTAAAFKKEGI